jgi:AcrR family transcriptional regulator
MHQSSGDEVLLMRYANAGRRAQQTLDTRQRLLVAAEQVLQKGGLAGLTVRAVSRAAGISEGNLYNHFQDKGDLVLAVVEQNIREFKQARGPLQPGDGDLEGNLRLVASAVVSYSRRILPVMGTLGDPDLLARIRTRLQQAERGPQLALQALTGYLQGEQRLGRVAPEVNPSAVSRLLFGACFHYVIMEALAGEQLPEGDFTAQIAATTVLALHGEREKVWEATPPPAGRRRDK